jgi:hypothetical protein
VSPRIDEHVTGPASAVSPFGVSHSHALSWLTPGARCDNLDVPSPAVSLVPWKSTIVDRVVRLGAEMVRRVQAVGVRSRRTDSTASLARSSAGRTDAWSR